MIKCLQIVFDFLPGAQLVTELITSTPATITQGVNWRIRTDSHYTKATTETQAKTVKTLEKIGNLTEV